MNSDDHDRTNSSDADGLIEIEKKLHFRLMDLRDMANSYLRDYAQQMERRDRLPQAFEKMKAVENQLGQIAAKISHWRKRMEYLADLKKHGWLYQDEADELNNLIAYGADWEYYTVLSTRIGPMRRRLVSLMKKKADKKRLKEYELAELAFLRNLGVDSAEYAAVDFDTGEAWDETALKAGACPVGGRIGYDVNGFEACEACALRSICSARAEEIEKAFRR
ncbi:MAG: hypothetical protein JXD19_10835 [Deltaproteobacteria bacterium]|nr:hypothetical protein [Deltaproteobacteria bacterium]